MIDCCDRRRRCRSPRTTSDMEEGFVTAALASSLTAADRCDRCGAQAYVRVTLPVAPSCCSAPTTAASTRTRCAESLRTSRTSRTDSPRRQGARRSTSADSHQVKTIEGPGCGRGPRRRPGLVAGPRLVCQGRAVSGGGEVPGRAGHRRRAWWGSWCRCCRACCWCSARSLVWALEVGTTDALGGLARRRGAVRGRHGGEVRRARPPAAAGRCAWSSTARRRRCWAWSASS